MELVGKFASAPWYVQAEHLFTAAVLLGGTTYMVKKGPKAVLGDIIGATLSVVPGAEDALDKKLEEEVKKTVAQMFRHEPRVEDVDTDVHKIVRHVPDEPVDADDIFAAINTLKREGHDPEEGKMWAYTYVAPGNELHKLLAKVYAAFSHTNALNPSAFPCLRKFENEVVEMTANLLGSQGSVVGAMTTGGTESILMAMKAYRELAYKRGIAQPEVVVPHTAHAAFMKAGHYFKMKCAFWVQANVGPLPLASKMIRVGTKGDMRADVRAMEAAITRNTIALVGSAPQYPHGVIDPIVEIAALAQSRGLYCHVDACVGGFFLPWLRQLGEEVPPFDFAVEGVTSMSVDLHKYGFCLKGTSVVMFRDSSIREGMYYVFNGWCGGIYASPSILGSRPGAIITAAWVALQVMGASTYRQVAKQLMETTRYLQTEINRIEGLEVISDPNMCIFAFRSTDPSLHIFALADCLEDEFGYAMERQPDPYCLHLSVTPPHFETKERFIADLKAALKTVRENPEKYGGENSSVAMYGMVASVPSTAILDKFVKKFLGAVFSLSDEST